MVQFNLPQSSKIEVGKYYKDETNSKNLKGATGPMPQSRHSKKGCRDFHARLLWFGLWEPVGRIGAGILSTAFGWATANNNRASAGANDGAHAGANAGTTTARTTARTTPQQRHTDRRAHRDEAHGMDLFTSQLTL